MKCFLRNGSVKKSCRLNAVVLSGDSQRVNLLGSFFEYHELSRDDDNTLPRQRLLVIRIRRSWSVRVRISGVHSTFAVRT